MWLGRRGRAPPSRFCSDREPGVPAKAQGSPHTEHGAAGSHPSLDLPEESSQPRRRAAEGWRGTADRCLSSLSQGLP